MKSIALRVPRIRNIWEQRERAIRLAHELSHEKARTQHELDAATSALDDQISISKELHDQLSSARRDANDRQLIAEELKKRLDALGPPPGAKFVNFCGQRLIIHGREGDAYFDQIGDNHANDFFEFAIKLLPENGVCFDVGANVGLTASALASTVESIHSFEPSPSVIPHLRKTISSNGFHNVIINHVAVGSEVGELRFSENHISASASHLISDHTLAPDAGVTVQVTTIDDYVEVNELTRLDFIKIDVEGFEIDVLKGAEDAIRRFNPSALVEFNSFTMIGFRDLNPRDFLSYFRGLFPFVYKWDGNFPVRISDDRDALAFLHDHLVQTGAVDDLLGSFTELDVRYSTPRNACV